jgi:hypothetical protein
MNEKTTGWNRLRNLIWNNIPLFLLLLSKHKLWYHIQADLFHFFWYRDNIFHLMKNIPTFLLINKGLKGGKYVSLTEWNRRCTYAVGEKGIQLDQRRKDSRTLTRQTGNINKHITKTRLFTKWVEALINSVALCKCFVLGYDVVNCAKWQSAPDCIQPAMLYNFIPVTTFTSSLSAVPPVYLTVCRLKFIQTRWQIMHCAT